MELLYLWIEDYKNIYRQGFNFSPLYDFEFTPTDFDEKGKVIGGKLEDKMDLKERETKEKFYKDFFNIENEKDDEGIKKGTITNVTAIVGENGAGKSSLIQNLLSTSKTTNYSFCVFLENSKLKFSSLYKDYQIDSKNRNLKFISKKQLFSILYSPSPFNYEHTYVGGAKFLINESIYKWTQTTMNYQLRNKNERFFENIFDFYRYDNIITYIQDYVNIKTILSSIFVTPSLIEIDFTNICQGRKISFMKNSHFSQQMIFIIRFFEAYFEEQIRKHNNASKSEKFQSIIETNSSDKFDYRSSSKKEYSFVLNVLCGIFETLSSHPDFFDYRLNYFPKIQNLISFYNYLFNEIQFEQVNHDVVFLLDLDKLNHSHKEKETLILNLKLLTHSNLKLNWLSNEKENLLNYRFLSSGEESIIYQICSIKRAKHKRIEEYGYHNSNTILVVIDEGELGLHPQWQKQYLKILLETLPKIFPKKQIQLILTSHSPFLVSDLPKENVIFLEKEDNTGLCKVSKLDSMKETFGANIHTLLTNSFFMKDGLTGTFAQDKIDKVIDLLNQTEELKPHQVSFCEEMIKRIGEPIVKNTLQKLLDSKRLRKVDEHDDKIKQLEKELEQLRGLVNQKARKQ